jgi:hypothetical protein
VVKIRETWGENNMNMFRRSDGQLDRQYLRTAAVFKMMKQGKITSKQVALSLLEERHGKRSNIKNTLEIWIRENKDLNISH